MFVLPARMRCAAPCFVTLMETTTNMASTISATLIFSVCMFMCFYVLLCVNPSMILICLARLLYLQPCRLFSKQSYIRSWITKFSAMKNAQREADGRLSVVLCAAAMLALLVTPTTSSSTTAGV